MKENDQEGFDKEIQSWIDKGILVAHDECKHGKIKRFVSLMSVRQEKENTVKIRPVLDYRELNKCVESHTAGAVPLCAERIRSWR